MVRFEVSVEVDHLARLAGQPLNGVVELIWNGLDADADTVTVEFERNPGGGIETIRVTDDGHGMTHAQATSDFRHLGGSWKLSSPRSKTRNRPVHGKAGQGRWRAFGTGAAQVVWETVAIDNGEHLLTRIEIRRENLRSVEIMGAEPTDRPIGTTVILSGISEPPVGLESEGAPDRLTAIFALHVEKYHPTISYDRTVLNPEPLYADRVDYPLAFEDLDDALLTVIQWKPAFERSLYLCDPDGIALEEVPVAIHAPGFHFTAYLLWRGFSDHLADLPIADFANPAFAPVIERARDTLRDHFRRLSDQRARLVIEEWKQEQIYPYAEPPKTVIEESRQSLFDLVAIQAASAVNAGEDRRAKRFALQLLREAVDAGPSALRRVLNEVLDLPKAKLDDLNALLDRTSLGAIIGAAKVIADRLDFLRGLEIVLFDMDTKRSVKERSQLHKILNNETWIFGEEWALVASDQGLTEALTQHLRFLERDYIALDEDLPGDRQVLDVGGRRRVLDLMLARAAEQRRNKREHLVVELKAPTVRLGAKELTQIETYAFAVAADQRFNKVEVQWDFVLISNELDDHAKRRSNQSGRPDGLVHESEDEKLRIWARPWSEIIHDCQHRLKFVQEQLQYVATSDHGVEYLRREHAAFLPAPLAGKLD